METVGIPAAPLYRFNPRPRERGDKVPFSDPPFRVLFQSTPL